MLSESQSAHELQHPASLAINKVDVGVAILDPSLQPLNQTPTLFELLDLRYNIGDNPLVVRYYNYLKSSIQNLIGFLLPGAPGAAKFIG